MELQLPPFDLSGVGTHAGAGHGLAVRSVNGSVYPNAASAAAAVPASLMYFTRVINWITAANSCTARERGCDAWAWKTDMKESIRLAAVAGVEILVQKIGFELHQRRSWRGVSITSVLCGGAAAGGGGGAWRGGGV